jgi:diadenosine tetraphosphate (Ap4A) HIT family hydrolase
MFKLHPQLAKDCLPVTDLGLCRVFLQNNSNFPWLVLVPMRNNLREIFDLVDGDYEDMMNEVRSVSKHFAIFTRAHKMNVAALGNVVPQLHIHVIARFENDLAWPNPVWNSGVPATPYAPEKSELLIRELRAIF